MTADLNSPTAATASEMVPEEDVVGGESYRLSNSEGEADSVHTSDTNTASSTAQTHTTTNTDNQQLHILTGPEDFYRGKLKQINLTVSESTKGSPKKVWVRNSEDEDTGSDSETEDKAPKPPPVMKSREVVFNTKSMEFQTEDSSSHVNPDGEVEISVHGNSTTTRNEVSFGSNSTGGNEESLIKQPEPTEDGAP